MHNTFLGSGKLELEVVGIKTVEVGTYPIEYVATILAAVVAGITQNVELYVEEFFKLETLARLLHLYGILGIMNTTHGCIARHKMKATCDEIG